VGAPSSAGPTLATKLDVVVTSPENTIEIRRWASTTRVVYAIERRLQVRHENVAIPTAPGVDRYDDVRAIDFRSGSNVDIQTWREEDGHIVVEIASTATGTGGGSSSWFLAAGNESPGTAINDAETVTFVGTGTATVTRAGNTILINVPANTYNWKASAGSTADTIATGETVTWKGATNGGITVQYNSTTNTFTFSNTSYWTVQPDSGLSTNISHLDILNLQGRNGVTTYTFAPFPKAVEIDRPLQIQQEGVDVGLEDTVVLDFDNATAALPASYNSNVFFEVIDVSQNNTGSNPIGTRRIRGWYDGSGGSGVYTWTASDGISNYAVPSAGTVTWQGNGAVSVVLTGSTFSIDRPLTIEDDNVAVGNAETVTINFDSQGATSTAQAVNFQVIDDGQGQRTVRGWVPSGSGSYVWNVAASGTAGSSPVDNTDTVTFIGRGGILVTRQGDNIIISLDPTDPVDPSNPIGKRRMTGEIVFAAGQADIYGGLPAYYYGVRRYVDIVHGWDMPTLNNFHLELVDKHLGPGQTPEGYPTLEPVLAHSRNTDVYPASLAALASPVRYRNLPHWAAIDRNTIRVWATMTEENTTDMVFRYVLTEE
jgi:hypothetical protein